VLLVVHGRALDQLAALPVELAGLGKQLLQLRRRLRSSRVHSLRIVHAGQGGDPNACFVMHPGPVHALAELTVARRGALDAHPDMSSTISTVGLSLSPSWTPITCIVFRLNQILSPGCQLRAAVSMDGGLAGAPSAVLRRNVHLDAVGPLRTAQSDEPDRDETNQPHERDHEVPEGPEVPVAAPTGVDAWPTDRWHRSGEGATVLDWWEQGRLPGYRLSSRAVRFRESEISEWLERRHVATRNATHRLVDADPLGVHHRS
jgi:hypothetical protein